MNSITDAFDTHAGPEQTTVDVQSLTLAQAQAGLEQMLMQNLAEARRCCEKYFCAVACV